MTGTRIAGQRPLRVAAVDVGTNTVRGLVADVKGRRLEPLGLKRRIVRLGQGQRASGTISDQALDQLREVLCAYKEMIRRYRCRRAWAVGTSAMRTAVNRDRVTAAAGQALGIPLTVISGDREALLTADGVQAGVGPIDSGLVVDIGGGSTEFVRIGQGVPGWHVSLDEGVVHLTELHLRSDPPEVGALDAMRSSVAGLLEKLPADAGTRFVATAGTPTTLAALDLAVDEYDPSLVNGHVLSRDRVSHLSRALGTKTAAARLEMPGMEPGREDLILAGVIMVEAIMDRWKFPDLTVSDWGLLEGVALACAGGEGFELS